MDTRYAKVSYEVNVSSVPTELDLVQEMDWEDHVEFLTLEEVGLEEEQSQPLHGGKCEAETSAGSVYDYCTWFYDNDEFSII